MAWLRGRTLGWPDPGLPAAALVYALVTAILFRELLPNVLTHVYLGPRRSAAQRVDPRVERDASASHRRMVELSVLLRRCRG